jgi:predicted unusual protein kinase regulating ubiquinone biosynthesis (AarF/ABC1/UbiB family)
VGQLLSVLDAAIPVQHRAVYGEVLTKLQAQAQALPWEEIAPVVADCLGGDPDALFAEVEHTPVAAASIGQVHRARLADGRTVAVKVQYPGVGTALEADLKNVDALVGSMTAVLPRTDVQALIDDVTATFLEELDYAHEAEVQAACAARWAGDPDILVPAVVPERSGDRVLTTTWIDGQPFAEARRAPGALRDRWGQALWRFTWTSITTHGWIHGDPHPGNLRFLPDGRLAVLDFGASATLPAVLHGGLASAAEAARHGATDPELLRHVLPAVGLPLDLSPEVARPWADFSRLLFSPMRSDGPFRFTEPYLQELMAEIQQAKTAAAKTALWKGVPTPTTAGTVIVMRTAIGQAAVLAHLQAAVRG